VGKFSLWKKTDSMETRKKNHMIVKSGDNWDWNSLEGNTRSLRFLALRGLQSTRIVGDRGEAPFDGPPALHLWKARS